jgi:hypothetical protein
VGDDAVTAACSGNDFFDHAREGEVYVVGGETGDRYRQKSKTPNGWKNCNLRTPFQHLLRRAALKPWPRLFGAMRASRETELARDGFPIHTVTAWLGNTPRIALKHYLMVTDGDFNRATGRSAKHSAPKAQNAAQHPQAPRRTERPETTQPLGEPRGYAKIFQRVPLTATPVSSGDRIRTCDLEVMSLASYLAAPPRASCHGPYPIACKIV